MIATAKNSLPDKRGDRSLTVAARKLKPSRDRQGAVVPISYLLALLTAARLCAQVVPGDPKAGIQVFFDKGCVRCHAILGEGGRSAPDLGRAPTGHLSAAELVAAMWNHAPAMWRKMRVEHATPPKFTPVEMSNLFAFIYSVRSLDEPGDAARGRKLLEEKKCLVCHAVAGQGAAGAPDLRKWASYRNPVSWVQAMWNHGATMQALMASRGLAWPEFHGNDMADMIAAFRTLAANPPARAQLHQANAENGRRAFLGKRCDACHSIRGGGSGRGPDLSARALPRTLGQFAGTMWNHAPAMWKTMKAQGLAAPQFSNQEMADLIAYLFTERYFEGASSAERGRLLFAGKGCGGCHGAGTAAPDLAKLRGAASPTGIATALWNHGPLMLDSLERRQLAWPRFAAGEIVDLMDYLSRGVSAPGAKK
jgi:mono/diheme cytochrome c family protein